MLKIHNTHCEFRLRNGRGKTCLWKKYILVYFHRQKQGKKNFWLPTLSYWATSQTAPASQPIGHDFMVHVWPSKGQCRNTKIFPPLLLAIKVDQNIFFPETCFASTISEPEFTVCNVTLANKNHYFEGQLKNGAGLGFPPNLIPLGGAPPPPGLPSLPKSLFLLS